MRIQLLITLLLIKCSVFSQSVLIENVMIIDGTGKPGYKGSLRIHNNQITDIGKLQKKGGEKIINGHGKILCPGFIDSHSHHLGHMLRTGNGISANNQGITTIIIGQDGHSFLMDTLQQILNQSELQVNIATYTGQTTLREMVMGENDVLRPATDIEIQKMKLILSEDIRKGSLGLSTGLEYEEAFYSDKNEVIELAKVASQEHGRYMSHIRSEDMKLYEALDEIINIGRTASIPVLVSHIKIANKSFWGQSEQVIEKLNLARKEGIDITADIYPYTHWHSTLRVLFPDRNYTSAESAALAVNNLFDPNESTLVEYAPTPHYKGMTLSAIAKERNQTYAQTLIDLVQMASTYKEEHPNSKESIEAIAGKSMSENDVINFLKWPHANLCSDGNGGGHPRGYGAFTRFLGRYIREKKIMPIHDAIYKMTGLTADHLGIKKRGVIANGNFADLVLLDSKKVMDHAIFGNSNALSDGIEIVWVNGEIVYQNQKSTDYKPGILIKRNE